MPLDPDNATGALMEACAAAGLDPTDAELIRLGESAVFRLRTSPVVVRVGRSSSRLKEAEREVAIARWLTTERVPAVHALDVYQPIAVGGRVVTFWESVSDLQEYGTTSELAALLRQLHQLTPPMELPPLDPFGRINDRIEGLTTISETDRGFLRRRAAGLVDAYARLSFSLPLGVIHGDASVGNVFRDKRGQALLGDLDGFVVGPREWDLLQTAIYYDRFGWHTEREYRAFADTYGYDVMAWPGYPVMRDVRELLMVTWLAQNAAASREVAAELAKRVSTLKWLYAAKRGSRHLIGVVW